MFRAKKLRPPKRYYKCIYISSWQYLFHLNILPVILAGHLHKSPKCLNQFKLYMSTYCIDLKNMQNQFPFTQLIFFYVASDKN